ncbi:MAG: hypothetical protein LBH11_01350 [Propionibacteriaceae bacterium]|jgi:hypothetical protein|nr:hypothetical protein [Propionibacteriaceae bacterium]
MKRTRYTRAAAALTIFATLALGGCSSDSPTPPDTSGTTAPTTTDVTEVAAARGRIALSYDGGILILDAATLETVADIALEGFNRLNPAGDERHLLVSTTGGFQVLDLGAYGTPHGDHFHYYVTTPTLSDVKYAATTPSHVVAHDDQTVLFDDATATAIVIESDEIADPHADKRVYTAPSPHHGVAVALPDGTLLITQGTTESRTGVAAIDQVGAVIASSDACPGVHGEAIAAAEAVVFGCQDGVLVWHDGEFTKIASPSAYGQVSTQSGTEASPVVLGNYSDNDPQAGATEPTRVSLSNTATGTMTLVELPDGAQYSSRSFARGEDGGALVLGTDGRLHVIDVNTASVTASYEIMPAWTAPEQWQQPRPAIFMLDGMAYITDPATKTLYVVYPATGQIWKTISLTITPNEISGVSGNGGGGHDHGHDEGDDHDHDHDHDHEHGEEG